MLNNNAEYEAMYHTESDLWWYRILHFLVLKSIKEKFGLNKDISILDAGCGTGGMLMLLKKEGYTNIKGFDFSPEAVRLCKTRDLNVIHSNLVKSDDVEAYDVVICNDVLYQFDKHDLFIALKNLNNKLKKEGILISNNQAFEAFRGTHDIAVGSMQRFQVSDFQKYLEQNKFQLKIIDFNYWSLLLSPLIFLVRWIQRTQLSLGMIDQYKIKSDVKLPPKWINEILYNLVKFELTFLPKKIFGSSLFIIFKKD